MTAALTLEEWAEITGTERELMIHHKYPHGEELVLRVLEAHVGEWVPLYEIQERTGQKAVAQRVSRLRHDHHFVIYCNHRSGKNTAYMLLPPPSFARVPRPDEPTVTVIKEVRSTKPRPFPNREWGVSHA